MFIPFIETHERLEHFLRAHVTDMTIAATAVSTPLWLTSIDVYPREFVIWGGAVLMGWRLYCAFGAHVRRLWRRIIGRRA